MSGTKKPVDWQAIERDYRAGILSLREMAALHGISHVSIKKKADKQQWSRDLTKRIHARADEIVNAATTMVNSESASSALAKDNDKVDSNGQLVANVRLGHRKHISRLLNLSASMLTELEMQSVDPALLKEFGEMMRNPNEFGQDRLNDLYQKIISTPGRVDTTKKLAETMRLAIGLEREAWGMDLKGADEPPKTSMAAWLDQMQSRRSALPVIYDVPPDDAL